MTDSYAFASDNTAPAAPEALEALIACNQGYASGYGTDHVTAEAADKVRALLDADVDVRFVGSGTAANALSLAALCRPFEAVLAHRDAHIRTDETGAPGYFGQGLGLPPLEGVSGRIAPASLQDALAMPESSYRQSPAALSLTQATEYGTVYRADELARLTELAQVAGLGIHLDGARIANAFASGFAPKTLKALGLDIAILGGTKCGMTPTEAIAIFNPKLSRRFDARLKQAGQLPSKGRYFAAPWIGMLADGAFVRHAAHANAMAKRLAAGMPFKILHPVEANGVFVDMADAPLDALRRAGTFVYRFTDGSVRFMCSWATTAEQVDRLLETLKSLA